MGSQAVGCTRSCGISRCWRLKALRVGVAPQAGHQCWWECRYPRVSKRGPRQGNEAVCVCPRPMSMVCRSVCVFQSLLLSLVHRHLAASLSCCQLARPLGGLSWAVSLGLGYEVVVPCQLQGHGWTGLGGSLPMLAPAHADTSIVSAISPLCGLPRSQEAKVEAAEPFGELSQKPPCALGHTDQP